MKKWFIILLVVIAIVVGLVIGFLVGGRATVTSLGVPLEQVNGQQVEPHGLGKWIWDIFGGGGDEPEPGEQLEQAE